MSALAGQHPLGGKDFERDPYGVYRALRRDAPVYAVEHAVGQEFVVTRYEDVETVLRDERFSVNRLRARAFRQRVDALPADLRPEEQQPSLLNLDPPDHTRLRGLVSRAFTPRRVEKLHAAIGRRAHELLDALEASGEDASDLISAYAAPLPAMVIADLLGVPEEDHARFRDWSERLLRTLVGSPPDLDGFRAARTAFDGYLRRTLEARRREPLDDLVSDLIAARDEDDALSEDELVGTCRLLLVAGHETTANWIGNGAFLLLSVDREARCDAFLADPETAAEELLRFESPLQAIGRVTREDLELGGVHVPEGSLVSAALGSANRDEQVFEAPDTLDLSRAENPHLSFGYGIHFCLGSSLARVEAQVALRALIQRAPSLRLRLADASPRWREGGLLRGLESLPVRVA